MLNSLRNFTLTKLHVKLNLPENEFQQWLTDLGMLHKKEHVIMVEKCVQRSISSMEDGGAKTQHAEEIKVLQLEHFR